MVTGAATATAVTPTAATATAAGQLPLLGTYPTTTGILSNHTHAQAI